jgi:hypothetical protein
MGQLKLILIAFVAAIGLVVTGCSSSHPACGKGMDPERTDGGCVCPAADLSGTPLQICGGPDASYSEAVCGCVGDE